MLGTVTTDVYAKENAHKQKLVTTNLWVSVRVAQGAVVTGIEAQWRSLAHALHQR